MTMRWVVPPFPEGDISLTQRPPWGLFPRVPVFPTPFLISFVWICLSIRPPATWSLCSPASPRPPQSPWGQGVRVRTRKREAGRGHLLHCTAVGVPRGSRGLGLLAGGERAEAGGEGAPVPADLPDPRVQLWSGGREALGGGRETTSWPRSQLGLGRGDPRSQLPTPPSFTPCSLGRSQDIQLFAVHPSAAVFLEGMPAPLCALFPYMKTQSNDTLPETSLWGCSLIIPISPQTGLYPDSPPLRQPSLAAGDPSAHLARARGPASLCAQQTVASLRAPSSSVEEVM